MDLDMAEASGSRAAQACVACRKQKRKCDKGFPSCSLCTRMGRPCDYSETAPNPSGDDFAVMKQKILDLEARLEGRRSDGSWNEPMRSISRSPGMTGDLSFGHDSAAAFPTAFFLDAEVFEEGRLAIPRPTTPVPQDVVSALGTSILDIQDVVDRYFSNIHGWLPFISKKRMSIALSSPGFELTLDLALLLLAMKLIIQIPTGSPPAPRSPLYTLTKRYLALVESTGCLTLQLLQAALLVAAYELGHGIYPAAYLTTGHCARLGHALGINDRRNAPQVLRRKASSWAEQEEAKRTWWTVMLLDRYVTLGATGHPPATEDPQRTDTLPASDEAWDAGDMSTSEPVYVSTATTVPAGHFARTCQATHLLGRLIRLLNDNMISPSLRFAEAIQLYRTLTALSALIPDDVGRDPERYGTPMALVYTAMLHLCDPFACTESNKGEHTLEETEMQMIAIDGLKTIGANIVSFTTLYAAAIEEHPAGMSPLVIDAVYTAAANYAWIVHESGSADFAAKYHGLRACLKKMNERWAVAGHYLNILDQSKQTLYPDCGQL